MMFSLVSYRMHRSRQTTGDDPASAGRCDPAAADRDQQSTTFIPVGRFFVNSSLSLLHVWRLLWQQREFFGDEGKDRREGAAHAASGLMRFARAARWTLRFLRGRRASRSGGRSLELPVNGDIAIERRSGAVKVLDLSRERMVTVMAASRSGGKLRARVSQVRRVENYPFAPRIVEVALEQGWFAESYVRGTHPTGFRGCGDDFEEVYLPLLIALARAEPPHHERVGAITERLAAGVLAPDALLWRLEPPSRERVRAFVEDFRDRIGASPAAGDTLPLVLSHGDFFSGNVVITPDGSMQAIDWAHLGHRSPLYDLYYLAINHCGRALPTHELPARIDAMLQSFRQRLATLDAELFSALESSLDGRAELRWLFYLECISVPLEHCDDPGDRYIAAMLQRIEMFEALERSHAAPAG